MLLLAAFSLHCSLSLSLSLPLYVCFWLVALYRSWCIFVCLTASCQWCPHTHTHNSLLQSTLPHCFISSFSSCYSFSVYVYACACVHVSVCVCVCVYVCRAVESCADHHQHHQHQHNHHQHHKYHF